MTDFARASRTSRPERACALATALACACHSSDRDTPSPSPPPRTLPADATRVTPARAASTSDATAIGSAGSAGATSDVTLTVDGTQYPLRWGYAAYFEGGARIELFDKPVGCAQLMDNDAGATAHLHVFVPSGPGGHYFTGHAIGVDATVLAPSTLPLPQWATIAKLEPSTWKQGARVRGTIEGHFTMLIGSAGAAGTFDVEVCQDLDDNQDSRVALKAPAVSVRGIRAKQGIAVKTVLALVRRAPATKDEATDIAIDRGHGSRKFLWFGFFAEPNVPCPPTDEWDPKHWPTLYLQSVSGAGAEHPLIGTQQPADSVFAKPGSALPDIYAVWRGWIELDSIGFDHGAKVRGTVWQEAPSFEDAKGWFGGRFEATVCDPYR